MKFRSASQMPEKSTLPSAVRGAGASADAALDTSFCGAVEPRNANSATAIPPAATIGRATRELTGASFRRGSACCRHLTRRSTERIGGHPLRTEVEEAEGRLRLMVTQHRGILAIPTLEDKWIDRRIDGVCVIHVEQCMHREIHVALVFHSLGELGLIRRVGRKCTESLRNFGAVSLERTIRLDHIQVKVFSVFCQSSLEVSLCFTRQKCPVGMRTVLSAEARGKP